MNNKRNCHPYIFSSSSSLKIYSPTCRQICAHNPTTTTTTHLPPTHHYLPSPTIPHPQIPPQPLHNHRLPTSLPTDDPPRPQPRQAGPIGPPLKTSQTTRTKNAPLLTPSANAEK